MKKLYNKLVRDKIPELIAAKGESVSFEVADTAEYSEKLREKLLEEVLEFLTEPSLYELADIEEVVYALAINTGYSLEMLASVRKEKLSRCGGFERRFILKSAG